MPDDAKPSFDQIRDALMPPGTDKAALWSALKNAQQTGGHVPGRPAPDISFGPEAAYCGTQCRSCGGPDSITPEGHRAGCEWVKDYYARQRAIPADPFTKGSVAAAGLAEMYEDLVTAGIPVGSVERILGAMLATYGLMTGDDES